MVNDRRVMGPNWDTL